MGTIPPFVFQYNMGEFVECTYHHGPSWYLTYYENPPNPYHGIIVGRYLRDMYYPYGGFYRVLCLDGECRYFAEWEIEIYNPQKS